MGGFNLAGFIGGSLWWIFTFPNRTVWYPGVWTLEMEWTWARMTWECFCCLAELRRQVKPSSPLVPTELVYCSVRKDKCGLLLLFITVVEEIKRSPESW